MEARLDGMEAAGMLNGVPVRRDGRKLWQYLAASSACMLAVGAGSALGWPSPVLPQLQKPEEPVDPDEPEPWIVISDEEGSWVGSLLALGAILGAMLAGKLADRIGRKKSLLLLAAPYLLAWTVIVVASKLWLIYASRFVIGVGVGASCVLVPTYISEIAETSARGTLGALFQLFFTVGIVFVFVLGSTIGYTALAIACALVEVVFLATFFWMPESPSWLVSERRKPDAATAMSILRGPAYDPGEELADMQKAAEESAGGDSSLLDLVRTAGSRRALYASFGCMIFQQLSGINAVIAYTFIIFKAAGSSMSPSIASIVVALVQMVMSGAAALIVDRAGRKPLLEVSSSVMSFSLISLGLYFKLKDGGSDVSSLGWLPLTSLTLFMIAFSIGMGPIPWMIMGELFPAETKAVASSMAVMVNWTLVFVVIKMFPALQAGLGADWTFWLFAAIMALSTVFTYFIVPETKGKTIQQIQEELHGGGGGGARSNKSSA